MSAANPSGRDPRPPGPLRLLRKAGVLLVGIPVVLLGIVLLPAPGPGTLVILAGLAILATEFPWASRQLGRLRRTAERAMSSIRNRDG